MELEKINVKLFTDAGKEIALDPFLAIFARWREDRAHPAGWIDLADYAHVVKGPGIMLIGTQGNLGFDLADPGPGILYANKRDLAGTAEDRLIETFRRALSLTEALIAEPEYPQDLSPRPGSWQLSFNDRLETPNTEETDRQLRPAIESAIERVLGSGCTLIRETDPNRRYACLIHADRVHTLDAIALNVRVDSHH